MTPPRDPAPEDKPTRTYLLFLTPREQRAALLVLALFLLGLAARYWHLRHLVDP